MLRVLVIGGYGNFGQFICKELAKDPEITVIVAGRTVMKALQFVTHLSAINTPEAVYLDIDENLEEVISEARPDVVIHTSGPFQSQSYFVAKACIQKSIHYIDLSDGRDFVANITKLDDDAKNANVAVISGASSVPCLTSALLDDFHQKLNQVDEVEYAISTAQKTARGLATAKAIMGYVGKAIPTINSGRGAVIYGWQDLKVRKYSGLGYRLLGNCDIPDLTLFPKRYPTLKTIRFYAGIEIPFIHLSLWGMSWLVRAGIIKHLEKWTPLMLKAAFLFDGLGSKNSAFHIKVTGLDELYNPATLTFELIAMDGDGIYIPCIPAILLTKKLAQNTLSFRGATPCVGLISKQEYLQALAPLAITWKES